MNHFWQESLMMKKTYIYLPFIPIFFVFIFLLDRSASGFYINDDWVYVLSFQYLAKGDYKALFSVVCEHRPILARALHYWSYICGYDGKPLLFLSQIFRLLTGIILVKHILEELEFGKTIYGLSLKITAITSAALILFSPVQAFAIARSTYIESYACVFGAALVISGAVRVKWWMVILGLIISLVSTPGWMVLLPLFVFIFMFYSVSRMDGKRKQILKPSGVIIILLILFYALNQFPWSHPSDHTACPYVTMGEMIKLIFMDTKLITCQYVAHLGFSMGWVPGLFISESSASYEAIFLSAFIAGVIFLLCCAYFLWNFIKYGKGSRMAIFILLWTLIMGAAITLNRAVILDEKFVISYLYPVYITPGWATLFFLIIQQLSIRPSYQHDRIPRKIKSVSVVVIIFVCIFLSYPKGYMKLKGTMKGMRYVQSLYRDGFMKDSVDADKKYDIAKTIFSAFPEKIYDGTVMLENIKGFPDAWKDPGAD
jgi:hypothetical protein